MKLPNDVMGFNKIRDLEIIGLYLEGLPPQEIKDQLKLSITTRRIEQIVYNNRDIIKIDRQWEETQQILRIKRHIKSKPQSAKDTLDWEELLDSKITPKKIEHSGKIGGQTIIVNIPMERKADYDSRLDPSRV